MCQFSIFSHFSHFEKILIEGDCINLTVSEFAQRLGISIATAYRYVDRLRVENSQCVLNENGLRINENGVEYAEKHFKKARFSRLSDTASDGASDTASESSRSDAELIHSLLLQLEEKDRQIASLIQQNQNFQVLLQQAYSAIPFNKCSLIEEQTEKPSKFRWWHRSNKK